MYKCQKCKRECGTLYANKKANKWECEKCTPYLTEEKSVDETHKNTSYNSYSKRVKKHKK